MTKLLQHAIHDTNYCTHIAYCDPLQLLHEVGVISTMFQMGKAEAHTGYRTQNAERSYITELERTEAAICTCLSPATSPHCAVLPVTPWSQSNAWLRTLLTISQACVCVRGGGGHAFPGTTPRIPKCTGHQKIRWRPSRGLQGYELGPE